MTESSDLRVSAPQTARFGPFGAWCFWFGEGWSRQRLPFYFWLEVRGGPITKDLRVNQQIRAREVRVIDEKGEQLGIMDPRDAVRMAAERELDLVEVSSPDPSPRLQADGLRALEV